VRVSSVRGDALASVGVRAIALMINNLYANFRYLHMLILSDRVRGYSILVIPLDSFSKVARSALRTIS